MKSIGVLGAGTWGMALAKVLSCAGNRVTVWSALEREIDEFSATRRHPNLPGMEIPQDILFTKEIKHACREQDFVLFAVPSVFVRATAQKAAPPPRNRRRQQSRHLFPRNPRKNPRSSPQNSLRKRPSSPLSRKAICMLLPGQAS